MRMFVDYQCLESTHTHVATLPLMCTNGASFRNPQKYHCPTFHIENDLLSTYLCQKDYPLYMISTTFITLERFVIFSQVECYSYIHGEGCLIALPLISEKPLQETVS